MNKKIFSLLILCALCLFAAISSVQAFTVQVDYDSGSLITPNGTIEVMASDSIYFLVDHKIGYTQSTVFIDGTAYPPMSYFGFDSVIADHTVYVTSEFVGVSDSSIVGLTEFLLFGILIFFMVLALFSGEAFLFAVTAFISIIFGLDLAFIYLNSTQEWVFGIVGFSFIIFGIWLLFYSLNYILKVKGKGNK